MKHTFPGATRALTAPLGLLAAALLAAQPAIAQPVTPTQRGVAQQVASQGVPLAALWVYDFSGQDADWNVTATNGRAYQLEAVAEANARLRGER